MIVRFPCMKMWSCVSTILMLIVSQFFISSSSPHFSLCCLLSTLSRIIRISFCWRIWTSFLIFYLWISFFFSLFYFIFIS